MSKVYIVIVNFNTDKDTIECLESVLKSSYTNFQVFIVDNSANDTSVTQLAAWAGNDNYPAVETNFKELVYPPERKPVNCCITSEADFNNGNLFEDKITIVKTQNNGFAAANNVVLKYLINKGEAASFIWLLNNDTVIEKSTLANLLSFCDEDPHKNHIVGAQLRNYYQPKTIQAIGGNYNVWLGKHKHIGDGETDLGQYDNYQPGKNDYIVGASMFLPKQFLDNVGLMCEEYFIYFEELDWINAGYKKGFKIATAINAIAYHKEGASIAGSINGKKDTTIAEYYSITSRVRFIKKWHPWALPTVMLGVIFALIKRLLQGRFKLVIKALAGVLKILFTTNPAAIKYDT
jgi:GT2 family glycosyltransferase